MLFGNKMDKIAKLAEKGDAAKIAALVGDKKMDVCLAAIDALGKCKGDDPFNALVPLLHSQNADVRAHAASALGALGDPRGRAHLDHQRKNEKDPAVLKAVEGALGKIVNDVD